MEEMDEVDAEFVTQVPDVSAERLRQVLRNDYGILGATITQLSGYDDLNFLAENCVFNETMMSTMKSFDYDSGYRSVSATNFIVKFTCPVEMRVPQIIPAQIELMRALNEGGIPCAQAIARRDGTLWKMCDLANGVSCPLRLLTFLPGRMLERFWRENTDVLRRDVCALIGRLLAKFHNICDAKLMCHTATLDAFRRYYPLMSARAWPFLRREFELLRTQRKLENVKRVELCAQVFAQFQHDILDRAADFEQGIIHSDVNESNLLFNFDSAQNAYISGLLDFGDAHFSLRIIDISNTILYIFLDDLSRATTTMDVGMDVDDESFKRELGEIASYILNAYDKERVGAAAVTRAERKFIGLCMKARLVASLIYAQHVLRINYRKSSDWTYIMKMQTHGWQLFEKLCALDSQLIFFAD